MSNLKLMWRRYNPKENIWKFQSDIPPSVDRVPAWLYQVGWGTWLPIWPCWNPRLWKFQLWEETFETLGCEIVEIQVWRFRVWNPSHQREVASREKGLALIRLQRERKQKTVGDKMFAKLFARKTIWDKTICKTICKENNLPQNVSKAISKENKNY